MFLSSQELALMAVTCLWGGTFLVLHVAMQHCGPLFFVGIRFVMAAFFVALVTGKSAVHVQRREVGAGVLIGCALALGYALQCMGLQTITASRSAFLTALYVPIVPLLQWVLLRKKPHAMNFLGIACAFAGLVVLAGKSALTLSLSHGDAMTVFAALAIALEIVFISLFAQGVDSRRVTMLQLAFGGVFAWLLMPVFGEALPAFSWIWLGCAFALALLSALVQLVMNWAQKSVTPSRATLIYAGEPVWGGLVGWLVGDILGVNTLVGAALIVAGVLMSELKPRRGGKMPVTSSSP